MLAIQGIYNGTHIVPLETLPVNDSVESSELDEDIRPLLAQHLAFDFWADEREDIYQEYLKKRI